MSQTSPNPAASDLTAAALDAHQSGRRDDAERLYQQAIEADPAEPTALYLYGLLNFETNRAERAAGLFDRVVALRPGHVEALTTLAKVRHWLGEHEAASEAYRGALAADPARLDAATGLANALRECGQAEAAVEVAAVAAARFPEAASAHAALAAALAAIGDAAGAVSAYRAAIGLEPAAAGLRAALAITLLEAGEVEAAATEAAAAVARDQKAADAWFARGAALAAQRRYEDAAEALERAGALDMRRAAVWLTLGAVYAELGRAEAARGVLETALTIDPNLAAAHANLSSVYLRADEMALAEDHARKALALDPTLQEALQNLASLLAQQGDVAGAREHRDRAYAGRNLFIERTPGAELTVLMSVTAESGNVPLDFLMPRARYDRLRWVVEYAPPGQGASLPPFDVVVNAIGDDDLGERARAPLTRFLDGCGHVVLNPPGAIARTRRDRLGVLLDGVDGVLVPRVARLSAETIAQAGLAAAVEEAGLAAPVLVRPFGAHGGKGLMLAETSADLATMKTAGAVYVTQFHDYRSADGAYRKYRTIFVDRRPYPYHLAVSPRWMVHYESAGMDTDAAARAEEARFLADPAAALGAEAMAAVEAIGRRLDLDYGGADFTVLPDGRVMTFEVNATMLAHPEAPNSLFAYKNPAVAEIIEAFQAMLRRAAGR